MKLGQLLLSMVWYVMYIGENYVLQAQKHNLSIKTHLQLQQI
jgi:hypothetical protein